MLQVAEGPRYTRKNIGLDNESIGYGPGTRERVRIDTPEESTNRNDDIRRISERKPFPKIAGNPDTLPVEAKHCTSNFKCFEIEGIFARSILGIQTYAPEG